MTHSASGESGGVRSNERHDVVHRGCRKQYAEERHTVGGEETNGKERDAEYCYKELIVVGSGNK